MGKRYDWLIVGGGIFGATFAYHALKAGKSVLVIDKRDAVGGNIRCEDFNGVLTHKYGAHIFHTDSKELWDFVNGFVPFRRVHHSPMAVTGDGKILSLPFSMYTFAGLWDDVKTPAQARARIAEQTKEWEGRTPTNLEEQALSLVGKDIYEALIKGYTEKQWGRPCSELPADIIKRLPLRFTFDNNYFHDRYVGIPEKGYNPLVAGLLEGAEVRVGVDYNAHREEYDCIAENILYTGCVDEYYNYIFGRLDYRSLRFETKIRALEETQGCSVVNYTGSDVPYTRIIEHNAFAPNKRYEELVISREYPAPYEEGREPYYPVINEKNIELYGKYAKMAEATPRLHLGGRLGLYRYMDMDDAMIEASSMAEKLL